MPNTYTPEQFESNAEMMTLLLDVLKKKHGAGPEWDGIPALLRYAAVLQRRINAAMILAKGVCVGGCTGPETYAWLSGQRDARLTETPQKAVE